MASGDPVVFKRIMAPGANNAEPSTIVGNSSPAENIDVWAFDAAAAEYLDFLCFLPKYGSGGLTFTIVVGAASATTGVARYGLAIRAIPDDAEDLDTTAHTYNFNEVDVTAPSAVSEISYDDITFTDGADMDSLAQGEEFILRFYRNATHANDTMAGDGFLLDIHGKET